MVLTRQKRPYEYDMQTPADMFDRSQPSKLFLEVTTRCNLRCKMCVKQSCDNGIQSGDMSMATFERLKPALANVDEVIISGIGEPLLHPQLETFIQTIKAELSSTGSVGLQTNGTLLTRQRIERLLSVDVDTICLSVDAATSELLASIRTGAQFDQLEGALSMLDAAKRSSCFAPSVGVQFVLMRDNFRHLPQVLRWAGNIGVDFAIVSHVLPFAPSLSPNVVYSTNSDAATVLFNKWKRRISRSGMRLANYPAASMKFYKNRTAKENKLIAMVETMKTEGLQNEISMNLARLMSPQDVCIRQVETVFEKAAAIAQASGMDLILPALQPSNTRHCSFIEQNSVFVDWQGSVSPCHFTWHPYACYPGGRKKIVQHLSFGNLDSSSLMDIWKGDAFRSFRNSVLAYDFPYCGDCSLFPCDYIDGDVFHHDCYTNTVPCCDCPWPLGVLNCLQ
jgi:putative metalloenzyme radical SAM/SPASM domain maturase